MSKQFGVGAYQYEVVEGWPRATVEGVAADVACDSWGRAYVAVRDPLPDGGPAGVFPHRGHVLVLDRDGRELARWPGFSAPHGIWINGDDEIFLADTGHHAVTKHAPSGEVLLTLGTRGEPVTGRPGTGPGEFNLPHDVMVDRESRVYVLDRENSRWQVFSTEGEFISECAGVDRPNDVAVDADGTLHIVSGRGVEIRRPDGELVGRWGEKGPEPGQFANGPHGVWMDAAGALYIAEVGGLNRLQKFVRV